VKFQNVAFEYETTVKPLCKGTGTLDITFIMEWNTTDLQEQPTSTKANVVWWFH